VWPICKPSWTPSCCRSCANRRGGRRKRMNATDSDRHWHGRAVAVTGATGFVGFHLARRLANAGARVRALVRPTADRARLVAGGDRPRVLDESAPWNLGRLSVPYATTKRQAEEFARAANGPGLEVVVVNPGCVAGPDDFAGSEFGTLCRRFWRGRVPIYFG